MSRDIVDEYAATGGEPNLGRIAAARRCVSHHHACDCREALFEQYRRALTEIAAVRLRGASPALERAVLLARMALMEDVA